MKAPRKSLTVELAEQLKAALEVLAKCGIDPENTFDMAAILAKAEARLAKKPAKRNRAKRNAPALTPHAAGTIRIEPGQRAEFHTVNGERAFAIEWDGDTLDLSAYTTAQDHTGDALAIMPRTRSDADITRLRR